MTVSRIGVSLEKDLLDALDEYVKANHFSNRSQAIRHLVNKNTIEQKWQCNNYVAGSVTLLYDPHRREIQNQISDIQIKYQEILSTQRIILDRAKHMEIIAVKGVASRLTELADKLITIKGMQAGKLTMSRAD
ncbi:MAG: nickel-responsive transcriptional regulator NikR [Prolixibacteraceae bacterium]|jgi:CopG family transcriptional regulator, nickel-responsive regulator|nr:nickel-responsive transcriptional regulator NikR [Prolixibacteraceae bacterium]MBT6763190.1 nickel-responsive transcriptional regulator NikR [Prolixibacteraceae bacterium]MBT6996957.1 nickel-responsive transcriptional regulator NikR [Prolixibacteraceae bacterium]MBT7397009.1 nickel-responsive transcriptional regulator NikR [Prolixibacteraceae bacterium]